MIPIRGVRRLESDLSQTILSRMTRLFLYLLTLCPLLPLSGQTAPELAYALSTRYAPYANWQSVLDIDSLVDDEMERYSRSAADFKSSRSEDDLPLAGLHLALDPGHVGGRWAAFEARDFVIDEGDFRVREGELVLEVAQRVRTQLVDLGARVTLLRDKAEPVNPKSPYDYIELASQEVPKPEVLSFDSLLAYAVAVNNRARRLSVVVGEIAERARLVNETIQPDALLSLHINAAPWPKNEVGQSGLRLVTSNHVHVLIFGCMSDQELDDPSQQGHLIAKLTNGSGAEEVSLGTAIGTALAQATQLPASLYDGQNAIRLQPDVPTLWARNLMLLRMVECPTVLLEPYVANSEAVYPRLQQALSDRAAGNELAEDDILIEYTNAVVAGIRAMYGTTENIRKATFSRRPSADGEAAKF